MPPKRKVETSKKSGSTQKAPHVRIKEAEVSKRKAVSLTPKVVSRHALLPKRRRGRGFSIPELKELNLSPDKARKLGLSVDPLRRSRHTWNVDALQKWARKGRTRQSTS